MFFTPDKCKLCGAHEPSWFIKKGYYKTRYNHQPVPRYRCKTCGKYLSSHTYRDTYKQHKPHLNESIFKLLCSGVTMRRTAKILNLNKNTIAPKMAYFARRADQIHRKHIADGNLKTSFVQFDEMETFEHTRMKPLSISIAIRVKTGEIIDTEVAVMPTRGTRTQAARKYYMWTHDLRPAARRSVMETVRRCAKPVFAIATDQHPAYYNLIKGIIPHAHVNTYGSKLNPEGIWKLNHIAAKIRADLARMARRTWSTTKKKERLQDHLLIYTAFNNGYKLF